MVAVIQTPIDIQQILRTVSTPRSGGIDVFIGTVRNHSQGKRVRQLEYTAYVPMAGKLMAEIEKEIREKWIVEGVALVHRIGMLKIGDIAVVTAVSAAHRNEAFEACRYAIDRVKAIVPVWKENTDLRSMVRGESSDGEIAEALVAAVWGKEEGHLINRPGFVRPERTMNQIGG